MKRFTTHRSATQVATARQSGKEYEARRLAESATRRLYKTAPWLRLRATQLAEQPLCAICEDRGVITPATVCDHIQPHRGDAVRFWAGPFQSLCEGCHNRTKQRQERGTA